MCYSHPENNTGEKRLEEEKRSHASHADYLCHPEAGMGSSTVWDTYGITWKVKDAEWKGVSHTTSLNSLNTYHENLMKKQQH